MVVLMSGWLVSSIAGQTELHSEAIGIARLEERMTAVEHRSDGFDKRFDDLDTWQRGIFGGILLLIGERALQYGKKAGKA